MYSKVDEDRSGLIRIIKIRNPNMSPLDIAELLYRYFRRYGTYQIPNVNPKRINKMNKINQEKAKEDILKRLNELGLSRQSFADHTNCTYGTINNYLSPSGTLTLEKYEEFSKILDDLEEKMSNLHNQEGNEAEGLDLAFAEERKEKKKDPRKEEFKRMSLGTDLIYEKIVVKAPKHMSTEQIVSGMLHLSERYKCDVIIESFSHVLEMKIKGE